MWSMFQALTQYLRVEHQEIQAEIGTQDTVAT